MKALTYKNAHALENFAIVETDVPTPKLRPLDVLVEIKAVATNPVDYKIRSSRSSETDPIILGWDMAGVVKEVGSRVGNFKIGDQVYGSGDITRPGSYAQLLAIDSRIIAQKPTSLSFVEAAALPLTTLTAWEALLEHKDFNLNDSAKVLIIGGAGGVGSIATQLLKAKTNSMVITTASRPESVAWSRGLGADHVLNHKNDLGDELKKVGISEVDVVFVTTHTDLYLKVIPKILRPFGHMVMIDEPKKLDIFPFKNKAQSIHWELMFVKSMTGYRIESQGQILKETAELIDSGKIRTSMNKVLKGLTVANIKAAHTLAENHEAIGKIVIEVI